MQDYGTVTEQMVRTVYHAEGGSHTKVLMEAIIYHKDQTPVLVLMRRTYPLNAINAIGIYTQISGVTLEEWKQNMEESTSMLWKPLPPNGYGLEIN